MDIRRFEARGAEVVSKLVRAIFKQFNAVIFEKKGDKEFLESHRPDD